MESQPHSQDATHASQSANDESAGAGSDAIISVRGVDKVFGASFKALDGVDLDIRRGEILALLGPNGAGKTTLINIICGIAKPTAGRILVDGHDAQRDFRTARAMIGLVPQELATDTFETVWATVSFSRGLFGKARDDACIEHVLRTLSLWEKRNNRILTLSGGMKRRVLIAKALAHEPRVLFLDEPTAGVDVELRQDMWETIRRLREDGVTIILTTHYIEEAEDLADRIGIIDEGRLMMVREKQELMSSLGRKQLIIDLNDPLDRIPETLSDAGLSLSEDRRQLIFDYDTQAGRTGITTLLNRLREANIDFNDLHTSTSSLEDIFVSLVGRGGGS